MKTKVNKIEKLKTISIVVLTVSAILLLYFLWENEDYSQFKTTITMISEGQKPEETNPVDLIVPKSIYSNKPGDSYKSADENIDAVWKDFIQRFQKFLSQDEIFVKEITKDQWEKALEYSSLQIKFGYDFDFTAFCTMFSINKSPALAAIESMQAIAYSEATNEGLLLYDQKNKKYYHMTNLQKPRIFADMIEQLETSANNDYYPMDVILGIANPCLLPVSKSAKVYQLTYQKETEEDGDDTIKKMARNFFGGNFDFIRTVKDNVGNTSFIYGYGEKLLTANKNGMFEYKEEISSTTNQESYLDDFNTSVKYVDNHGGWGDTNVGNSRAYLKSVEPISTGKKKGFRFKYGFKIGGVPVFYENNDFIVIDIVGNQVIYYKRSMIDVQKFDENFHINENFMYAKDVITKNYETSIKNILIQNGIHLKKQAKDSSQSFEDIANRISDIKIGYLRTTANHDVLQPAWVITMENMDLFFDLYTGDSLGYTKIHK